MILYLRVLYGSSMRPSSHDIFQQYYIFQRRLAGDCFVWLSFSAHTCARGLYDTHSCQAQRAIIQWRIYAIKDRGGHKGQRSVTSFLSTRSHLNEHNVHRVASYWEFASQLRLQWDYVRWQNACVLLINAGAFSAPSAPLLTVACGAVKLRSGINFLHLALVLFLFC